MSIVLEQLTKRYDGQPVVNNLSLEVQDGEFFVLLGSSGSGKTTVLSMIAGLTDMDSGRILLHGRDVSYLPTQERRVGFVFQNYALFEHMNVGDNIEFGLRVQKTPAAERRRRREELLELVGLSGLGSRMPRQLSGGQQQRVALARALAHRPDVLLLDEPLGALDAKIRVELRRTVLAIQRELGIATILVTHDQEEAFELADRLGVMSYGRLLEVGPPQTLYREPKTEFVATFLGTANLLVGQSSPRGIQVGPLHFPLDGPVLPSGAGGRVQALFRPEDVVVAPSAAALSSPPLGEGQVEEILFGGAYERLRIRLPAVSGIRSISPPLSYGGDSLVVEATRTQEQAHSFPLRPGDRVWMGVNRVYALDHPGLRFLVASDGSQEAKEALRAAGQLARLAHARVLLVSYGEEHEAAEQRLQEARELFGGGLVSFEARAGSGPLAGLIAQEVERQPIDLVIAGANAGNARMLAQSLLQTGQHHVLLTTGEQPVPRRALICVATGEPGKEDVLFAGRLVRHLEAEAQLLVVLPPDDSDPLLFSRAERFLQNGERTLQMLGVQAQSKIRRGDVYDEITAEIKDDGYDLLVLGAPLPARDGSLTLSGVTGRMLEELRDHPILIVRSEATARPLGYVAPSLTPSTMIKEIIE